MTPEVKVIREVLEREGRNGRVAVVLPLRSYAYVLAVQEAIALGGDIPLVVIDFHGEANGDPEAPDEEPLSTPAPPVAVGSS